MTVFQALVLGILQGLAEFLPISSSAHLALAPWLFGWPEPGLAVDVALHVGTLVAVLVYFRDEWVKLIVAALQIVRTRRIQTVEQRRAVFLIVATIPGGIAGLLLNDYAESTFRSPALIAIAMAVMGVVLWLVDTIRPATRPLESIAWSDAILIGIAQAAALLPGVSRSGATISAGLLRGFDRTAAARYSFLLSVPAVVLSGLFELKDVGGEGGAAVAPTVIAPIVAFVTGYIAIAWLLRYLTTHTLNAFVAYRIGLGVLVLALTAGGAIS
jgi:undecaprenyl-diphosphatase